MLSIFPSLLSFQQLSPFLIRVTLAIVLLFWAYKNFRSQSKLFGLGEAIAGALIMAGFLTQIAAIVTALGLLVSLLKKIRNRAFLTDGINYHFILFILAISLIFTGPGAFGIDLPL